MIKIIATDLDGTLLDKSGHLPPEFKDILKELKKMGIIFVVATGRSLMTTLQTFEGMEDDIVFLVENGGYVYYKGEDLYKNSIPQNLIDELLDEVDKIPDVNAFICGKRLSYLSDDSKRMIDGTAHYKIIYKVVEDLRDVKDDFFKLSIFDFIDARTNSYPIISKIFKGRLTMAASGKDWVDITNIGVTKGVAMKILQEKYGISQGETLAIGDYDNDIEMMARAFHSYAMQGASEGLLAAAKFRAGGAGEGAIAVFKDVIAGKIK